MTEINLEAGMPTADAALRRLNLQLQSARAGGTKCVKVIHGYGSTGNGGAIRTAVRKELSERKRQGRVKLWIPGEEFSPFFEDARTAVYRYPALTRDRDYGRTNQGITIVVL